MQNSQNDTEESNESSLSIRTSVSSFGESKRSSTINKGKRMSGLTIDLRDASPLNNKRMSALAKTPVNLMSANSFESNTKSRNRQENEGNSQRLEEYIGETSESPKEVNEITKIYDNLFLSSEKFAHDLEFLTENNITRILNVAKESSCKFIDSETIQYHWCKIEDYIEEDIKKFFEEAIDFIERSRASNNKVLVHCSYGISRSPTIVIAYLMKKNLWKFKEAYDFVKSKRDVICPNVGFVVQLTEYEKIVTKLIADAFDSLNI